MKKERKVEDYLRKRSGRALFFLLDPDKVVREEERYKEIVEELCPYATAFFVGGSTGFSQLEEERTIRMIKAVCDKPVVIFPGSPAHVAPSADAILFMSLLNSRSRKFLIEDQLEGALLVWRYGLEAIPTAYLIVGEGGTAGWVGDAKTIPLEKPELLAMYALAAKYLGFRAIYVEAGSGARTHVPPQTVAMIKKLLGNEVFLMIGGGIKNAETALSILKAGADGIIIGTLIEKEPEKAVELAKVVRESLGE
ncbi:geranylgeranylglyceryl phosphate synthase [Ignicoccus pacificus DSM 13166]|uniref:Geranylgeranylglyceryl phosphate synthase n=1 Tax=Ignicoccus pacificus DSM 13166 TaxID=940294 RepID=A0A977KAP4_9CREN|nr:geranylgeranylglyceryl phosphate synthase [Ignicoccus pacificus DSM 13166]